jgi:hypothetical protein
VETDSKWSNGHPSYRSYCMDQGNGDENERSTINTWGNRRLRCEEKVEMALRKYLRMQRPILLRRNFLVRCEGGEN